MITETIKLLALLTIIGQVFVVLSIFYYFFQKKLKQYTFFKFFHKNALLFAFIVATTATLGSLFFQFGAKFTPCELCWWQRIFMYPLSIIFGIAYFKRDFSIKKYVLPLIIIGLAFASYHYYIQKFSVPSFCSINEQVSCSVDYIFEFGGYVTITMMSLTAFSMLLVLLSIYLNESKKRSNPLLNNKH